MRTVTLTVHRTQKSVGEVRKGRLQRRICFRTCSNFGGRYCSSSFEVLRIMICWHMPVSSALLCWPYQERKALELSYEDLFLDGRQNKGMAWTVF